MLRESLLKYFNTRLLFLFAVVLFSVSSMGSHIVGGELTYQCLGGGYYNVNLRLFRDCGPGTAQMPTSALIRVRAMDGSSTYTYTAQRNNIYQLNISQPACATLSPNFCVETATFSLDSIYAGNSPTGFNFYYQVCCRNANISNIVTPNTTGITISSITTATTPCNNSPYFNHNPPLLIPFNIPLNIDASAIDPDGDSLYYRLCTPYDNSPSAPQFDTIIFNSGNNSKYPISSAPPFVIDPITGIITGTISQMGNYQVSICVEEYRNGVYIGKIQRDYQFNAIQAWTIFANIFPSGIVQPTCNGNNDGSISVTVAGGTPPYSYQWSNSSTSSSLSNLGPGTYQVIVTDANNCTDTADVVLIQPLQLSLTMQSHKPATCLTSTDGDVTVTASGGTTPYTIVWDTGTPGARDSNLTHGPHKVYVADSSGCWDSLTVNVGVVSNMAISLDSVKNPSCPGAVDGYVGVSFAGGRPPYNHIWADSSISTSRGGLSAGSFTVYLSDSAGCYDSLQVMLQDPQPLNITVDAISHVSCNGQQDGAVQITTHGGTGPYNYNWNGVSAQEDVSGLGPGSAILVINDANGCTFSDTFLINEPAVLLIDSVELIDASCATSADGAVKLSASGGRQPYIVSWSNSQTGSNLNSLLAGTYNYVLTDSSGCQIVDSIVINSPQMLVAQVSSVSGVSCPGGQDGAISVSATGGVAPYQYIWNAITPGGASNSQLPEGPGLVVIRDSNGCESTVPYNVPVPDTLKIILDSLKAVSCFNGNDGYLMTRITGGTPPIQLSWSHGPSGPMATALSAGTYTLTATDAKGCISSKSFTISEPTELFMAEDSVVFTSCQSASDGQVHLSITGGVGPYTLRHNVGDTAGHSIYNLPTGNHSIRVDDANGCIKSLSVYVGKKPPLEITSIDIESPTCFGGDDGSAVPVIIGGQPPYSIHWSTGHTGQSELNLKAGRYEVSVVDRDKCRNKMTFEVLPPPPINLDIEETPSTCMEKADGELKVIAIGPPKVYNYFVDSIPLSTINGFLLAGSHHVMAVDEDGCHTSKYFTISSKRERLIFIPNAFTPNSDGINEHFNIVADKDCFPNPSFKIFNRWGEIVFSSNKPFDESWDGFVGQHAAIQGTYFYRFDSDHYKASGIVTIFY